MFSAQLADKNTAAYGLTLRLLFLCIVSGSLLSIAFGGGDYWEDSSTAILQLTNAPPSGAPQNPLSVLTYSGSLTGGSVQCYTCAFPSSSGSAVISPSTCSAGGSSCFPPLPISSFSEYYTGYCANTNFPAPPFCAGMSAMLGISIFIRICFPFLLLLIGWATFLCCEALLRMHSGKAKVEDAVALLELRPQGLLPLLLAILLLTLTIVIAQPSAANTLLNSLATPLVPISIKVAIRPGAAWFLTAAAATLLGFTLFSAFRLEALAGGNTLAKFCSCCPCSCNSAAASHPPGASAMHSNPVASLPPGRAGGGAPLRGAPAPWMKMKDDSGDTCVACSSARARALLFL